MTVQELRDLLNAYRDETILIQEGRKEFEYWPVALGEAQAALSGAIIAALPALLDIADAAKELCDPDGIIRLMRGDSETAYRALVRLADATRRLEGMGCDSQ